ncbi:MAG TPA: sugar transferase [Anaerolineae bacterium]|nr:sugar transferase [Anaerolineae bacterium]
MSTRYSQRIVRYVTIITDLILINFAFRLAYIVRYDWQWLRPPEFVIAYREYIDQQSLITLLLIITFLQNKVWQRRRGEFWVDEVSRLVYATAAGIVMMMAVTWFVRPLAFSRLMLVWAMLFITVGIGVARLVRRFILGAMYRRGYGADRVLLVGTGEGARGVLRTLLARPDLGYKAIGYLDDGNTTSSIGSGRIPRLGAWEQLAEVLLTHEQLHTVFIALPAERHHEVAPMVQICYRHGVRAQVVPSLLELSLSNMDFNYMSGIPLLSVRQRRISPWGRLAKRGVDLLLVSIAAVPALLLSAMIAAAIKLDSSGPIFFRQARVGENGRLFHMIKFRSMVVDADDQKAALQAMNEASGPIFKIKDDPRLTRVGRWIRRLSLDELPQLYNILRGHMSLVGPRPPLPDEVEQYQPWHRQRLAVKGGLTGLWQVSGRSDLTFDEQCLLDIYYIENWSLALDVRIILQTVPYTLFGRGAY